MVEMKVAILCGGEGMRMRPYSENLPKPLMSIGEKPMLWHIMKIYQAQGFKDFILCLGYKGEKIKKYFANTKEDWNVTCADTGLSPPTGERLKKIEKLIDEDVFFATYGDGLANINLKESLEFHISKGKIATMTVVRVHSPFGLLKEEDGYIVEFREKPLLDDYINGGFFVFRREIFNFIKEGDSLESDTLVRLVKDGEVCAYKHHGFWRCVDTFKDLMALNDLWKNNPEWKIWRN